MCTIDDLGEIMPVAFIFLVLEILAFALVASVIGWGWALLLIIAGSMAGLMLLRVSNLQMAEKLRQKMATGKPVDDEMREFPFRMIAGFLLFMPGFITDAIAMICLIPEVRRAVLRHILRSRHFSQHMHRHYPGANTPNQQKPKATRNDSRTIEGEYWKDDDKKSK
ncbi:MAG: FxsA family protein [Pseudomonadota bacterium]